jgi:hypothetical protein
MSVRSLGRVSVPPPTMMVWSVTDEVVESEVVRAREFHDIRAAGFSGVMAFVRCSRYSWDDPLALLALRHIAAMCRREGMHCWLVPDPRLVSHKLVGDTSGLELVLFGNAGRAEIVPHTAALHNGGFTVRCALPPRHVHTLTEVAVEFRPRRIARAYALRLREGKVEKGGLVDVTSATRMFYNARDRYVEAFGRFSAKDEGEWRILAFFHVGTNHFDFSDIRQRKAYAGLLKNLQQSAPRIGGVAWDEPGFTCVYGSLPFSPSIRRRYRRLAGEDLAEDLWKLAYEAVDGSHLVCRMAYYESVQEVMQQAEQDLDVRARKLWGPGTVLGIHDTWHFESADMCDMNHGSLDLWQTVRAKSGGFVDLGGVQELANTESGYYAHLAALSIIAATLGKLSRGGYAYNNLWTVGDDEGDGSQRRAMDHCVKVMALFGTRWLAHAYGPVGTVGQERTFLGSPPLPGYPHHSTWQDFPRWNSFFTRRLSMLENRLPESNVLVLYPLETLYALADTRADLAARGIFELLLLLLDHHYHVDVIGTTRARFGFWRGGRVCVDGLEYNYVIYPYPAVFDERMRRTLSGRNDQTTFVFGVPERSTEGRILRSGTMSCAPDAGGVLDRLRSDVKLRPVLAPAHTWVTMTRLQKGTLVSLAPARAGRSYAGAVEYAGKCTDITETAEMTCLFFPDTGEPRILGDAPSD